MRHTHTHTAQLTIRKCQNTDDKKEGDDQDEPNPEVTVIISIISAGSKVELESPRAIMTSHNVEETAVIALEVITLRGPDATWNVSKHQRLV